MIPLTCLLVALVFALAITSITGAGVLGAFLIGVGCGAIAGIVSALLEGD